MRSLHLLLIILNFEKSCNYVRVRKFENRKMNHLVGFLREFCVSLSPKHQNEYSWCTDLRHFKKNIINLHLLLKKSKLWKKLVLWPEVLYGKKVYVKSNQKFDEVIHLFIVGFSISGNNYIFFPSSNISEVPFKKQK